MNNLICYKTLSEWTFHTIPLGFRDKHNTKIGTWAKLSILAGNLKYYSLDEQGNVLDTLVFDQHSDIPFIEPQVRHKIEPLDEELRCQLSFYCQPEDYYHKKYGLTAPHSEVLEAMNYIKAGKALDVGCGRGRNTLFLQQRGFTVNAFDKNADGIDKLHAIIAAENLDNIDASVSDIQLADITEPFDLVVCTVVLMFLEPNLIPQAIEKLQNSTKVGGYNVIVSAVDSEDYPLPSEILPFGFKPNELANYYQRWDLKKYNEDVGQLHRVDADGNRIALRFASMIAQKP